MKLKLPNFIRSPYIDLHVYTDNAAVYDLTFIDIAGKTKKEFMKRTLKNAGKPNISGCPGFIEMQKRSVQLKSWVEWDFGVQEGKISFNSANHSLTNLHLHEPQQTNGWAEKNNIDVVKVVPPFLAECEEEVNFMITPSPFMHQNIYIPSGITSFKHKHSLAFFMYVHKSFDYSVDVKLNDNLVNYTPLSDRKVKVHNHYDKDKFNYLVEKATDMTHELNFAKKEKVRKENQ